MVESSELTIAGRRIGAGRPSFLIAEVAQAHDGSLGIAHSYIDAVADTGVDAIKFQTHFARFESSRDDQFRVTFSPQDESRYVYWQRMEFSEAQWRGLFQHARERRLILLSSAFSVEAVEMLRKLGVPAWKVGSGEFFSDNLLDEMSNNRLPILLSTGLATWPEVDARVRWLNQRQITYALFQCTSKYPSLPHDTGLNVIDEMRERFACAVGLSDHSGTIFPALAAMARGADMIEVHVVFDRRMFGPDSAASLTPAELEILVQARDAFHQMQTSPVAKDNLSPELQKTRELFTKSVALTEDLRSGTALEERHLAARKPGNGIPFSEWKRLLGRRLKHDVQAERLLRWDDLADDAH